MKLWTPGQMSQIRQMEQDKVLPSEIANEIERILDILDTYYGRDRDVDEDDGGYIILERDSEEEGAEQYKALLEGRHLREGEEEYCDILQCKDGSKWQVTLWLVTNDYGVTVIRRMEGERR